MDVMGIIAFSTALPLAGSALTFAIITLSKCDNLEKRVKELEGKIKEG